MIYLTENQIFTYKALTEEILPKLEKGIVELVKALNSVEGVCTFWSCEGHLSEQRNRYIESYVIVGFNEVGFKNLLSIQSLVEKWSVETKAVDEDIFHLIHYSLSTLLLFVDNKPSQVYTAMKISLPSIFNENIVRDNCAGKITHRMVVDAINKIN